MDRVKLEWISDCNLVSKQASQVRIYSDALRVHLRIFVMILPKARTLQRLGFA